MELQEKTLGQCFREACRRNPERLAAVDSARKYTYEELKGCVDALAGSFLAHGFSHGSHIGIFCGNRADALIAYFAVWSIGAVLVPLNRLFTER
jgi:acyl-CoA synthetase (AMP-forming)/AMP-acid ligase II